MSKTCTQCQAIAPDDARFCPECGAPMTASDQPEPASPMLTVGGIETVPDSTTLGNRRAAATPQLEPGAVFAERYEIQSVVGVGGMGVVYKAKDRVTERTIALKLIRPERLQGETAVKRLIAEGVTARDIRHPNIVAVYDVGEAAGTPYVSMEYIDGRSLRAWHREMVRNRTDVPLRVAARIVAEILDGLKAAHDAGVIHRDLKPENIILTGDPDEAAAPLKILDFGIARAAGAGVDSGTGTGLGTPRYMAPEQITNPDATGPSADLYSLSVLFYELLVDVLPQGHWQPPSGGRSDVPQGIDALIEQGLSNRPANRPQSAAEYRKALVDAVNLRGPVRRPQQRDDKPKPAVPAGWRRYALFGVAGLGALAIIGGIGDIFAGSSSDTRRDVIADDCDGLTGSALQACRCAEAADFDACMGNSVDPVRRVDPDDRDDPPPPPPPTPTHEILSGRWHDGYGGYFDVTVRRNLSFSGSGLSPDGTRLRISGQLSRNGASYTLTAPDLGFAVNGLGTWDGACHMAYTTYNPDGMTINLRGNMHLAHPAGAPCPSGL